MTTLSRGSVTVEKIALGPEDTQCIAGLICDYDREYDAERTGNEAQIAGYIEDAVSSIDDLPFGLRQAAEFIGEPTVNAILVQADITGDLPPTPERYQSPDQAEVYDCDFIHLALASLAGVVFAAEHVRGGRLFSDIFPRPGFSDKPDSAFGSNQNFGFHVDGVHQTHQPDAFSLQCLRNEEQAPTILSGIAPTDLPEELFQALQDPVFTIYYQSNTPSSHKLEGLPLLEKADDGTIKVNYYGSTKINFSVPSGQQNKYSAALIAFRSALQQNAQSITLQPGEVLHVKNRTTPHARPGFESAVPQSQKRWLRRLFIASDEEKMRYIQSTENRITASPLR